ncbi:cell division control protein Cdc6 [Nadsonia fulvescens var. elongata DSM 6958]|uniref:Cell division control protein n=1 Tax=Nadsonia fulvescens var. elongata DSM 6958 TaxID=857566 RepID=A0A1E3PTM6_9ASCO|nr:cell division control protein Cdc6 [Nadsonia fulvescens var. elongata DSM 6958]
MSAPTPPQSPRKRRIVRREPIRPSSLFTSGNLITINSDDNLIQSPLALKPSDSSLVLKNTSVDFDSANHTVSFFDDDKENIHPMSKSKRSLSEVDDIANTSLCDSERLLMTPSKKRVYQTANDFPNSPLFMTPPSTPKSVYSVTKGLFQRGNSKRIIGRDTERQFLSEFIEQQLLAVKNFSPSPGALYISGPPGTGKSALLAEIIDDMSRNENSLRTATINCMIVNNSQSIYAKIYEELYRLPSPGHEKCITALEDLFVNTQVSTPYVIVLDEIDHIVTKDQQVLFRIFSWAFNRNSNLILIGISNTLNLTDKFLPRLKTNNFQPKVLRFTPYSSNEIVKIISERLLSLLSGPRGDETERLHVPLMHPAAIQLVAKKISASTGDIRKAFDICRRAIELVEEDVRKKNAEASISNIPDNAPISPKNYLVENNNDLGGAGTINLATLTYETAPKVMISHVSKICSSIFGGSSVQRIKSLNLQQKAILCTLVSSEKSQRLGAVSATTASGSLSQALNVQKLFDNYSLICRRDRLLVRLSQSEFIEIITTLESSGLINLSSSTTSSGSSRGAASTPMATSESIIQNKIKANVQEIELLSGIGKIDMLKTFIHAKF